METAKPRKPPAPVHGIARLELLVDGNRYAVRPLEGGAWRLRKVGSRSTYVLTHGPRGPSCSCQDYKMRRQVRGLLCKHGSAAVACGLMAGHAEP